MARIKFTAIVESIRGSIAGTTFQQNAYGYTIKTKPNTVNPSTQVQQARKTGMVLRSKAWSSLAQSDRDSWDSYAQLYPIASRLNPSSNLNGYNYFMRYHLLSSVCGIVLPLENAGVNFGSFTFEQANLTSNDTDEFRVLFEFLATNVNWNIMIYMTPPIPESRNIPRFTPRFIAYYPAVDEGGGAYSVDQDLTDAYNNVFNTLPLEDEYIAVRFRLFKTNNATMVDLPITVYQVGAL